LMTFSALVCSMNKKRPKASRPIRVNPRQSKWKIGNRKLKTM
jgi:hypothetical protein